MHVPHQEPPCALPFTLILLSKGPYGLFEGVLVLIMILHVPVCNNRWQLHGLEERFKIGGSIPPIDF